MSLFPPPTASRLIMRSLPCITPYRVTPLLSTLPPPFWPLLKDQRNGQYKKVPLIFPEAFAHSHI